MLATNKRMNQFYHKRLPGMDLDVGTVLAVLNPDAYLESGLFLLCNGAVVSRTTYARLFNFVSTHNLIRSTEEIADLSASEDYAFGPGDGSTTFSIPNMIGRTIFGGTNVGKYQKEQLPNISGKITADIRNLDYQTVSGVFSVNSYQSFTMGTESHSVPYMGHYDFSAQHVNAGYTDGGIVLPRNLTFNYIIKGC